MTTLTSTYLDAVEHLPTGGTLILTDVSWEDYEQLLADLGAGSGVRVAYHRGRLEIMSPSSRHEKYKDLILRLADTIADELDYELESFGSTTFKARASRRGGEPDTCFYVQQAASVAGKEHLDLSRVPLPDVVGEVDVSHRDQEKFALYADLGVPEIWRYDEERAQIYHLTQQGYVEAPASRAFPLLTSKVLSLFLERSKTERQRAVLKSFRQWVQAQDK